jgi:hypothetical protein
MTAGVMYARKDKISHVVVTTVADIVRATPDGPGRMEVISHDAPASRLPVHEAVRTCNTVLVRVALLVMVDVREMTTLCRKVNVRVL